jgi:hypothetical protein
LTGADVARYKRRHGKTDHSVKFRPENIVRLTRPAFTTVPAVARMLGITDAVAQERAVRIFKVVGSIPTDQAFRPLSEGKCAFVAGK